jgi:uncharacterized phage protein (TIGR01671 family)
MKREILFKAIEPFSGKWVFGNLLMSRGHRDHFTVAIQVLNEKKEVINVVPVSEDTVCQFTGLTDKNGNKIFEGDILRHRYKSEVNGVISFFEGSFIIGKAISSNSLINFNAPKNFEIIGNIHE